MIYVIFLFFTAFIFFGAMILFFVTSFYMIIFEAEKLRQKMVALPEYKETWVFWASPYKPFKWWHFYRKAVFLYCINSVFISKRERKTSVAARKITEIMPRHVKNLYRIQAIALVSWMLGLFLGYFLH